MERCRVGVRCRCRRDAARKVHSCSDQPTAMMMIMMSYHHQFSFVAQTENTPASGHMMRGRCLSWRPGRRRGLYRDETSAVRGSDGFPSVRPAEVRPLFIKSISPVNDSLVAFRGVRNGNKRPLLFLLSEFVRSPLRFTLDLEKKRKGKKKHAQKVSHALARCETVYSRFCEHFLPVQVSTWWTCPQICSFNNWNIASSFFLKAHSWFILSSESFTFKVGAFQTCLIIITHSSGYYWGRKIHIFMV